MPRAFYVYILANRPRTIYVGVTNDVFRRVLEHRSGRSGFARRYMLRHLKGWIRAKKIALIEASNPTWEDLAAEWFSPLSGR